MIRRRVGRGGRDRGATLPEYALGVGLVVVASIGVVTFLEDESGNALDEQAEVAGGGNEVSGAGYSYGGGGGGTTTGGSTGGTPPPTTTVVDGVTLKNAKGTKQGKDPAWIANVTVDVSASGDDVEGATVQVTFANGAFSSTVTCPQTSDSKGEVECELASIPNAVTSVTATVEAISGTNITYTPPSPKVSTSISAPPAK